MMHMQELEGDPRSLDFNGRSLSKRNFQLFSITELEFAADQTVPIDPLPCRGMHLHGSGSIGTVWSAANSSSVIEKSWKLRFERLRPLKSSDLGSPSNSCMCII